MMWTKPKDAQVEAFSVPDTRPLAFRLPGHMPEDRAHLLARKAFGYRGVVHRDGETWVVNRRTFGSPVSSARSVACRYPTGSPRS